MMVVLLLLLHSSKDKSLRIEVSGCLHVLGEVIGEISKKHHIKGGDWPFCPEASVKVHLT